MLSIGLCMYMLSTRKIAGRINEFAWHAKISALVCTGADSSAPAPCLAELRFLYRTKNQSAILYSYARLHKEQRERLRRRRPRVDATARFVCPATAKAISAAACVERDAGGRCVDGEGVGMLVHWRPAVAQARNGLRAEDLRGGGRVGGEEGSAETTLALTNGRAT